MEAKARSHPCAFFMIHRHILVVAHREFESRQETEKVGTGFLSDIYSKTFCVGEHSVIKGYPAGPWPRSLRIAVHHWGRRMLSVVS